mmetsp:Transcript_11262/g.26935  ORF Transcript_11262/g.26935 Transcript_11262/m.26935 type:complete len:621 (+) Transcript_11262:13-1875(+)
MAHRLKGIAAHVAGVRPSPCIGESSNQDPAAARRAPFHRVPIKIVFEDQSAADERYGGSGTHVILEGELLQPPRPSNTVIIFMHPSGIQNLLPMPMALAREGLHVVTMASRYPNNDSALIMEKVVIDLGATVRHCRRRLGYKKVVLAGWSGGGSLSALYQSQAEKPTITCTPAGDPVDLSAAKLIPADGLLLLAAHSSRARIFTEWLDPAVLDESDPSKRDPALDIFGVDGPKPPFSPEFVETYRAAQLARNRRITAWAQERVKELNEQRSGWQQGQRDLCFTVHCTQADIARLDTNLDHNQREPATLEELAKENHSPAGLARYSNVRSWLSQWSVDLSRADALACLPHTSVPTFVLHNAKDHLAFPSHAKGMYSAIRHNRKKYYEAEDATHYFFGQPEVLTTVAAAICDWLVAEKLVRIPPAEISPPLSLEDLRTTYGPTTLATKLELQGLNHVVLVSSDMDRTAKFVSGKLGFPLVKAFPVFDGAQHFFFDAGNGCHLAYFWYPKAPPSFPGVSSANPKDPEAKSAHGSMNHVAWRVPTGKISEYRQTLADRGVLVSDVIYHDNNGGFSEKLTPTVSWASCYFYGPDGEYFEFTEQHHVFGSPEREIEVAPKTRREIR